MAELAIVGGRGCRGAAGVRGRTMGPDRIAVDIALYVALSEEFHVVSSELGRGFEAIELDDVALTCFVGSIRSDQLNQSFQVLVVPAGKMGPTRSANVMSAVLAR